LLFLALLPLGFVSCFLLGYYFDGFRQAYFALFGISRPLAHYPTDYDAFWNDAFGLRHFGTLTLWLVPYLAVTLLRSIRWSIKALNISNGVTYGIAGAILLIAAVCLGVVVIRSSTAEAARKRKVKDLQETINKIPKPASAQEILSGIRQARQNGHNDFDIYEALVLTVFVDLNKERYPTLRDLERFFVSQASGVSKDDLKEITLFDAAPNGDFTTCIGFHGRIQNGLPRTITKIGLQASFYNSQGQLIEIKRFWMTGMSGENEFSARPRTPVGFNSETFVGYLTPGWKWQLEVTEAHYSEFVR